MKFCFKTDKVVNFKILKEDMRADLYHVIKEYYSPQLSP